VSIQTVHFCHLAQVKREILPALPYLGGYENPKRLRIKRPLDCSAALTKHFIDIRLSDLIHLRIRNPDRLSGSKRDPERMKIACADIQVLNRIRNRREVTPEHESGMCDARIAATDDALDAVICKIPLHTGKFMHELSCRDKPDTIPDHINRFC